MLLKKVHPVDTSIQMMIILTIIMIMVIIITTITVIIITMVKVKKVKVAHLQTCLKINQVTQTAKLLKTFTSNLDLFQILLEQ